MTYAFSNSKHSIALNSCDVWIKCSISLIGMILIWGSIMFGYWNDAISRMLFKNVSFNTQSIKNINKQWIEHTRYRSLQIS